jgi:hypothetical protein
LLAASGDGTARLWAADGASRGFLDNYVALPVIGPDGQPVQIQVASTRRQDVADT